jgi:hypothetical protein
MISPAIVSRSIALIALAGAWSVVAAKSVSPSAKVENGWIARAMEV